MPTHCTASAAVTLCVCVFIVQAYTPVLHISVSIQRSFPESLSKWGFWEEPQLETSYQPAMADVSWVL